MTKSLSAESQSLQELLRLGWLAQKDGDYVSAIANFESAMQADPVSEEAAEATFTAWRQLSISQFLVERFFCNLGWSPDNYKGFDHGEPRLSRQSVQDHLNQLVQKIPQGTPVAIRADTCLKVDHFAKTGQLNVDPASFGNGKPTPSGQLYFLVALTAIERGDSHRAVILLSSLIRDNPMCGSAYLALGQILYREGQGTFALANINLAFFHPEDFWLDPGTCLRGPVDLGEYKGYQILFIRSEFYAVPHKEYFLSCLDEQIAVYQNRISQGLRKTLLEILPHSVVETIRSLIYSTPLRHAVRRAVPFTKFFHGKDLLTVVSAIEHNQTDLEIGLPQYGTSTWRVDERHAQED